MRPPGVPALNTPDHYSTDTSHHSPPDTGHHSSAVDHASANADPDAAHATYLGANTATRVLSASDLSYLANAHTHTDANADADLRVEHLSADSDADTGLHADSHPWSHVFASREHLPSDALGQPHSSHHSWRRVRFQLRYRWPGNVRAWRHWYQYRHRHWFAG